MSQALLIKELRESAGLLAVAVLACGCFLATLTGFPTLPWQSGQVASLPFVTDGLSFALWLVGGALAILLGLKQTAWEAGFGTYAFLLHRPVPRWKVFALKIAFGVAALLLITGLFILAYAAWAATPGVHAAPFFWTMTLPAWKLWFALPLLYLGAFFSGIRPARWFGTKLAPLAASAVVAVLLSLAPWFIVLGPLGYLAFVSLSLLGIFYYVQHRDF